MPRRKFLLLFRNYIYIVLFSFINFISLDIGFRPDQNDRVFFGLPASGSELNLKESENDQTYRVNKPRIPLIVYMGVLQHGAFSYSIIPHLSISVRDTGIFNNGVISFQTYPLPPPSIA
ncbi:MAG: hypothetical protein A2Y33_01455 [Spirochaetes bacterium GWF1_51_8]|nr:MAG: hypothetical protein A2Y33_01455 [Spirochaetes bacterium GWF1_51_8]